MDDDVQLSVWDLRDAYALFVETYGCYLETEHEPERMRAILQAEVLSEITNIPIPTFMENVAKAWKHVGSGADVVQATDQFLREFRTVGWLI